jgi:hypothetical protein
MAMTTDPPWVLNLVTLEVTMPPEPPLEVRCPPPEPTLKVPWPPPGQA